MHWRWHRILLFPNKLLSKVKVCPVGVLTLQFLILAPFCKSLCWILKMMLMGAPRLISIWFEIWKEIKEKNTNTTIFLIVAGEIGKQLNNNIKIFHENGYCFSLYCNTFYCKKDLVTYYRNFDKIERFLFDTLHLCRW